MADQKVEAGTCWRIKGHDPAVTYDRARWTGEFIEWVQTDGSVIADTLVSLEDVMCWEQQGDYIRCDDAQAPEKPDPRDAVIEAARKVAKVWMNPLAATCGSVANCMTELDSALTALDAAKAASPK